MKLLLDCVMFDTKNHSIVVSPKHALEHGATNLRIAQTGFASKTIFNIRLDYELIRVKRE